MVHRFVAFEQKVLAEQPETADLPTLFREWGLTNGTQEAIWVIAFDNMDQLKTVTEVARGGFHDVLVYPANVLAAVLSAHTNRFYIARNHPSGPVTPTADDMNMTANIMAAANAAGLSFEDHIITGPEGWFSFYDAGLLVRAEGLGVAATRLSRQAKPKPSRERSRNGRAVKMRGDALLYLPGNPSHWFASTGRGIRYVSLCGVDRRNKRYRPKRGARRAQCELCRNAGGVAIPGSPRRREVASRAKAATS